MNGEPRLVADGSHHPACICLDCGPVTCVCTFPRPEGGAAWDFAARTAACVCTSCGRPVLELITANTTGSK